MSSPSHFIRKVKRFLRAVRRAIFGPEQKLGLWGSVTDNGLLRLNHDSGFFSNCSVALRELARSPVPVVGIDARRVFKFYSSGLLPARWKHFFSPVIPTAVANYGEWETELVHHEHYEELDISRVTPLIHCYFRPSQKVVRILRKLVKKYEIDLSKTIAVHYRGTDKAIEVTPIPVADWFSVIDSELADAPPHVRLLIQTDDFEFRQAAISRYGDRVFFFSEIPVTDEFIAVHHLIKPWNRRTFGRTVLAATILVANCSRVITHTGNGGLWAAIYRGSTNGLTQMYGTPVQPK